MSLYMDMGGHAQPRTSRLDRFAPRRPPRQGGHVSIRRLLLLAELYVRAYWRIYLICLLWVLLIHILTHGLPPAAII